MSLDALSPARAANRVTQSYTALAQQIRTSGLQRRTHWFYGLLFAGLLLGLAGVGAGFILLGESWLQLLIAAALGVLLTQLAFVGHEASHRQILTSGPGQRPGRLGAGHRAWWGSATRGG